MEENIFIDYSKILSYNALINLIITARGIGKTYGATKLVIDDFLKNKNEFAYIRRFKSELKEVVPTFFTAINKNNEYPDHTLVSKHNAFYCDDQKFGYAMNLATAQNLKSSNYSNVRTIIFDEFIIEEGQKKFYLKNEVFVFLNLIETICRMRNNVRILMLGNAGNLYTVPYILFWNITMPYNTEFKLFQNNQILLYYKTHNEKYLEEKRKTKFGKLIQGTAFEDYAVNNKVLNDNKIFIEKKQGTAKFSFAFIFNEETFGIWIDNKLRKNICFFRL